MTTLLLLLTFRQLLLPSLERLSTRCRCGGQYVIIDVWKLVTMITYCSPQRHLVDSRSNEGSSGCRNVKNNNIYCHLLNLSTYVRGSFDTISKFTKWCYISLILKIGKIRNIRFVGNLILNIHQNFCDDIIVVVLSVNRMQCICVFFSPPVICHNSQVINSIGTKK